MGWMVLVHMIKWCLTWEEPLKFAIIPDPSCKGEKYAWLIVEKEGVRVHLEGRITSPDEKGRLKIGDIFLGGIFCTDVAPNDDKFMFQEMDRHLMLALLEYAEARKADAFRSRLVNRARKRDQ